MKSTNKREIAGSRIEFMIRKAFTGLFYYRGYRLLYPSHPDFAPAAIRFVSRRLRHNMKLFEYGAGLSSLWFAERVAEYIAVEHDKEWFDKITQFLHNKRLDSAQLLFRPPQVHESDYSWQNEWRYFKLLRKTPDNPEFKEYIFSIDAYADHYFDVVIVDGRERIPCLIHAKDKTKQNGFLILDDSARPRYQIAFQLLKDWSYVQFNFGMKQTTIFSRNKDILK